MPTRKRTGKRKGRGDSSDEAAPPLVDIEKLSAAFEAVGRVAPPPQALEAEQAVLGSMLMEREAIRRTRSLLAPEDFYAHQHQSIARAIFALHEAEQPVDTITVQSYLQQRPAEGFENLLEATGGLSYLLALQQGCPTAAAVRGYALIVREQAVRREVIRSIFSYMARPDPEHMAALVEALERGVGEAIEIIEADDLTAQEIQVDWLVEDMSPLGGVTLIAGDWYMGKSWLALSACHAVAHGYDWLGRFHVPRGGALYVDNEAGPAGMRDRLLKLDTATGVVTEPEEYAPWDLEAQAKAQERPGRPLSFCFYPDLQLGPRIGALEAHIRERRLRLVVLDSLMTMLPDGVNINSNTDVVRILRPVRRLAHRTNCAIWVVHHMRKGQAFADNTAGARILGAQAAVGEPDATIVVDGEREGIKIVAAVKVRAAVRPVRPFKLGFSAGPDGKGTMLLHDGAAPEPASLERERAMEAIIVCLQQGPHARELLFSKVCEAANCSETTVERALKRLDGTDVERRTETTKQGRRSMYHLKRAE